MCPMGHILIYRGGWVQLYPRRARGRANVTDRLQNTSSCPAPVPVVSCAAMSTPPERADEVPLPLAAELAAIPARTLRNWIKSGKLAAKRGQRGWLVRTRDVEQVAIMIGHPVVMTRPAAGQAAPLAGEVLTDAPREGETGGRPDGSGQGAANAAIVAGGQQAEAEAALRRLLAPFIAEQTRLAEELGRARARAEAAERERDALRARLSTMVDTPQAAPAATEAPTLVVVEADTPRRRAGLWTRLRRVLGGWGES